MSLVETFNPAAESQAITLAPSAIEKLTQLGAEENNPELGLRLGVTGGGCSGFKYFFNLVDTPEPNDQILVEGAAKVMLDQPSLPLIQGSTLKYIEDLSGARFELDNPQAVGSCSCGTSFGT